MSGLPVLSAAPVEIRHIKRGAGGTLFMATSLVAQPRKGVNGQRGYQSGSYETAINEEGAATLTFPNTAGDDGLLHRRRFALLATDQAGYHPGDEWVEIWQSGRVLFVGTPISGSKRSSVTVKLADGRRLLVRQFETAAGFWNHAPRDVFEHYTKAWVPALSDDFVNGADPAKWGKSTGGGVASITDQPGAVRLTANQNAGPILYPLGPLPIGATDRAWRWEMEYSNLTSPTQTIGLQVIGNAGLMGIERAPNGKIQVFEDTISGTSTAYAVDATSTSGTLALEVRDRWAFYYANGALVTTSEAVSDDFLPRIYAKVQFGTPDQFVDVQSVLLRRCDPYLMRGTDKGDYRLPGVLPSGGLKGTYYDESDLPRSPPYNPQFYPRVLSPTRPPYARRQDPVINFPQQTVPTWQPPTPPNGEWFSARWTGAIYLDLAAADVTFRVKVDDAARLWVGKTMFGQQLIDGWPVIPVPVDGVGAIVVAASSMRAHLGTQESGWYPIRLEYANAAGPGGIVLERSVGGGTYSVVPATALSPYGIYESQVRYESHAAQLQVITDTYGLQARLEPRSLESGLFPGELVPRVRVGRDTDKVLTPDESTEVSVDASAEETLDTLIADAAGIADRDGGAQLTAEVVNYPAVGQTLLEDRHPMILSDYESLSDITDLSLLRNRLDSLLGLRTEPWEEVAARPRGHSERRDSYPLTGTLALFDWEPGDAIRLRDDRVDLNDTTPRQIIAPSWPFVPDGRGAPTVRFRQRPRSQKQAVRELIRAVLAPQRSYQGQLAIVQGTWSTGDGGYSRVALPRDLADVMRCELVIGMKSDTSAWNVLSYPAAVTIATFTTVGRIDLLAYLSRRSDPAGGAGGPAMLISTGGGTGIAEYQLELVVRV